jgi:hypothetical protein
MESQNEVIDQISHLQQSPRYLFGVGEVVVKAAEEASASSFSIDFLALPF